MKKHFKLLFALVAVVVCAIAFSACGNANVGTYKFNKLSVSVGSSSVDFDAGGTVSEDAFALEIKDDGTWAMAVDLSLSVLGVDLNMKEDMAGTWEEQEGKLVLKSNADNEIITAVRDGNKLTMTMSMTVVLLKATLTIEFTR